MHHAQILNLDTRVLDMGFMYFYGLGFNFQALNDSLQLFQVMRLQQDGTVALLPCLVTCHTVTKHILYSISLN